MIFFDKHTFNGKLFYLEDFHLNLIILLVYDFPMENLFNVEKIGTWYFKVFDMHTLYLLSYFISIIYKECLLGKFWI